MIEFIKRFSGMFIVLMSIAVCFVSIVFLVGAGAGMIAIYFGADPETAAVISTVTCFMASGAAVGSFYFAAKEI